MAQQTVRVDRSWRPGADRPGRPSILTMLLGADDEVDLMVEPEVMELARRDVFQRELAAAARQRRVFPPRRHLRK